MRTDHHAHVGALEEGVQVVSAKVDHIVLLLGIADEVVLEAILVFVFMRIGPEQVNDALVLLAMVRAELNLVRPRDLLDSLDVSHSWANTAVAAEDLTILADGGRKRQVFEHLVDLCKATVGIVDILTETSSALSSETQIFVDMLVFVVATQQDDLLGVLQLESHQEADDLERVVTLIHVVTQEQVVVSLDIAGVRGHSPELEEAHKLNILAMEIAENLDRRSNVLDDGRLGRKHLSALIGDLDDVLAFQRELGVRLDILTILGSQQRLKEQLTKCLIRVLVNLGTQLLLVGVQLLGLLGELVDGDLAHNEREVFGLRVLHVALVLRCLSGNMRLIRQLESAVHVVQRLLVLLDGFLLVFVAVLARFLWRLNLLKKTVEAGEQLLGVDLANLAKRNVRDLMLKATMHVDVVVRSPARVAEALHRVELVPLGRFSVVDLERDHLADLVGSTTDNHHERTQEESRVLITRHRTLSLCLVRSLHPVPSTVAMSAQTPRVEQTGLVGGATTEADHHASGTAGHAERRRVVHTHLRSVSAAIELHPTERSLLDAEAPDIVDGFLAGVTTEDKQVRLGEDDRVAITSAGR